MIYNLFSSFLLSAAVSLLAPCSHCPIANAASADKENEVKSILQRMETDVLAFRDEMERVYSARCDTITLTECAENNFNDCSSTFSSQQCMKADELVISTCGDGETCNALWDKTLSAVSIPASIAQGSLGNPHDEEVIESACYSRLAERYMMEKYKADEAYWTKWNVQPSWTYFGAHNGLFRKIPATHQEECGQYDPRRRPWFVAASSGPKDVIIVIDVSGSMNDYGRLVIAKDAAITIVETLTVADRVAVVSFSSRATQIGGFSSLIRATNENKENLINAIENLDANGATNFYDGFKTAFDAVENTIKREITSGCNVAVLFMTDGEISEGPGANEVINLVNDRTERLATDFNRIATLFTFSLGYAADHTVTKSIACSTNGVWTPVDDFTGDLVTAMSSYYKLFALGLGEGGNEDFTAWVEPYEFNNPAGKMGTTVSAPVYDRSVNPPLFLGVVAVDIYMDALEQVLEEDATSSTMLQRFIQLSTARCPKLELTECELDGLRFLGGGEQATCGVCNGTYAGTVPEKCPFQSDLPNNLWHNTDMEGKKYEDRACCENGGIVPSQSCPPFKLNRGAIAGMVIGSLLPLCVCAFFLIKKIRQVKARKQQQQKHNTRTNNNESTEPKFESAFGAYEGMNILPPPSAPAATSKFDAKQTREAHSQRKKNATCSNEEKEFEEDCSNKQVDQSDSSLSSKSQTEPESNQSASSHVDTRIVPPFAPKNSPAFGMKRTKHKPNPYPTIRKMIPELAKALLDLPDCPVWIHEKKLCKIVKIPTGTVFGQRDSLSCLLGCMERGYRIIATDNESKTHGLADFSKENGGHRITFQYHGRAEPFPAGTFDRDPVFRVPRWFRIGEPMTSVATQSKIVGKMIGEARDLPERVARDSWKFIDFFEHGLLLGPHGYGSVNFHDIAYEFRHIWPDITVDVDHVFYGVVQRRSEFALGELEQIKWYLRMMIAASNKCGRLILMDGIHTKGKPLWCPL